MAYDPVVDDVAIASTAVGLLVRDTALAATVWRDPVTDFARKKNDTVSVYLPAYVTANKRSLRANAARVRSALHERKIDISLENDLQVDVPLTDENQTLDLDSLALNVIAPSVGAIVRAYDEEVAAVMEAASPHNVIDWDPSNPYDSLVDAGQALDDASVPATGRHLAVGSELAAQLLKDELLVRADKSGSTQTLRQGVIGDVAGFTVMKSLYLSADVGFAYHTTGVALCSRAPVVPDGVAWGSVQSSNGFAIRVMQHLADDGTGDLLNLVYHDSWFGCSAVTDNGHFTDSKFIPSEDPEGEGEDDVIVRLVQLDASGS